MVFPSAPGNGAGIPHLLSRVSARGLNPSSSHLSEKLRAFSGSCLLAFTIESSFSPNFGKSKNQCFDDLTTGGVPQNTHLGVISSRGSKTRPHESHWSPLACSNMQWGHFPSTKRSGRKRASFSQ